MKNTTTPKDISAFTEYLVVQGYSKSTRETIQYGVKRFIQWLESENMQAEQVGYNDVMAYVKWCKTKGNTARTLQVEVNAVRNYYSHLINMQMVTENPCSNIEIRGAKRRILYRNFEPSELDDLYKKYAYYLEQRSGGVGSNITRQRNKLILSLVIYQGITMTELEKLNVNHVQLREGKIHIPQAARNNSRDLKLEAHQLYDMMDYINEGRKALLVFTGKQTEQLFTSTGAGEKFHNMTGSVMRQIRSIKPEVKSFQHIRDSVIVNWLKIHDVRKVQYMAGHRYVSSTEAYQVGNMDELIGEINKFHPDL